MSVVGNASASTEPFACPLDSTNRGGGCCITNAIRLEFYMFLNLKFWMPIFFLNSKVVSSDPLLSFSFFSQYPCPVSSSSLSPALLLPLLSVVRRYSYPIHDIISFISLIKIALSSGSCFLQACKPRPPIAPQYTACMQSLISGHTRIQLFIALGFVPLI